jgi:hypothetical protein
MLQLYLRHDLDNIIFKMKHKLHIASGAASTVKNSGCAPGLSEQISEYSLKKDTSAPFHYIPILLFTDPTILRYK